MRITRGWLTALVVAHSGLTPTYRHWHAIRYVRERDADSLFGESSDHGAGWFYSQALNYTFAQVSKGKTARRIWPLSPVVKWRAKSPPPRGDLRG
ncbi:MAG: hypothetical protein MI923_25455 [Phycisphaerales bacterium]|nr:hypothetical protein [Phycisphaerales bacterium]